MDGFMEIVAAIDSFKGSMTSVQAGKPPQREFIKLILKQKCMSDRWQTEARGQWKRWCLV